MMAENTTPRSAAGMEGTALNSMSSSPIAMLPIHLSLEMVVAMAEKTTPRSAAGTEGTGMEGLR